jgi:hypothetical protein
MVGLRCVAYYDHTDAAPAVASQDAEPGDGDGFSQSTGQVSSSDASQAPVL